VRRFTLVDWLLLRLLAWLLPTTAALQVHVGRLLDTAARVAADLDKFMMTRSALVTADCLSKQGCSV
jgi:hypothetical protein